MKKIFFAVFLLFILAIGIKASASQILYGVRGRPGTVYADLITIDPVNGTLISEIGSTGLSSIGGFAINPLDGTLYAIPGGRLGSPGLYTLDPMTGLATLVGGSVRVKDMDFDSSGTLYAVMASTGQLATIDLTTGGVSVIGDGFNVYPNSYGLAFDSNDTLYIKRGVNVGSTEYLYKVDKATGAILSTTVLTRPLTLTRNSLTIDSQNTFYSVCFYAGTSRILTINPLTGIITVLPGNVPAFTSSRNYISGIDFAPTPDFDGDGIMDPVDGYMDTVLGYVDESDTASDNFTDENIDDGTSFGYIQDRSTLAITVDDAVSPDGLQLSATGDPTKKARVRVCDLSPPDGRIELTNGDSITVTCDSLNMEVLSGPVELLLDDDNVEVIVGAGAVVLITESENGQLQIENQSAGGIPVEVIVDGVSIELAPGEYLQSTAIDILPADPENCINVKKKGKIPIAVFGSNDLDVTQIDPATCELEDTLGVCTKGKAAIPMASIKDVDLDGIDDLVMQFEIEEGFFNDQTSATVTCELFDGDVSISGYDTICTVP